MRLITAELFSRDRVGIAVRVAALFRLHGQLGDAAVLVGVVDTRQSPLLARAYRAILLFLANLRRA